MAPVTKQGATSRRLYLPRGIWYDFWTEEELKGGREIDRPVDLETLPLYLRAGALVPMGPIKRYAEEKPDDPLRINIYPGTDGEFTLYEDDGSSFNYQRGETMRLKMFWKNDRRQLSLSLAEVSRMRAPTPRQIETRIASTGEVRELVFAGRPVEARF